MIGPGGGSLVGIDENLYGWLGTAIVILSSHHPLNLPTPTSPHAPQAYTYPEEHPTTGQLHLFGHTPKIDVREENNFMLAHRRRSTLGMTMKCK